MTDSLVWTLDPGAAAGRYEAAGGGSQPIQTGAGDPIGSVTPLGIGYLYLDMSQGAIYQAEGLTSSDWVAVGGGTNINGTPGVQTFAGLAKITDGTTAQVAVQSGSVNIGADAPGDAVNISSAIGGAISATDDGSHTTIGFFSATPVAQPSAPVTLGDVIAALKALGLVAA